MFESAPILPPDAIFGLNELFRNDTNDAKISLTIGVYKDENGQTPLMGAVADAEQILLDAGANKSYLPIDGMPAYNEKAGRMVLGSVADSIPWATSQTPGGTGALRVTGELLKSAVGVDTIWMSQPTWANHPKIFGRAGFHVKNYAYLDERGVNLDFESLMGSFDEAKAGQAILLHAACHNPTGVDLNVDQWKQLLELVSERGLIPVFDFAYQGFGSGLEADAQPLRDYFAGGNREAIICNSFSKNFGLYGERVGGITIVSTSEQAKTAMQSQVKTIIRTMYSNPPTHGGAIVNTILADATLQTKWAAELDEMRERISGLRSQFVDTMKQLAPEHDFDFINQQRGMFSYSGLSKEQAVKLREEHSIYILNSGRINIAGINASNRDQICKSIAAVL